jgi:hypothetical protein
MSKADVKAKVEWEGGIVATLNYGLRSEDIADPALAKLWAEAIAINRDLDSVVAEIREALR